MSDVLLKTSDFPKLFESTVGRSDTVQVCLHTFRACSPQHAIPQGRKRWLLEIDMLNVCSFKNFRHTITQQRGIITWGLACNPVRPKMTCASFSGLSQRHPRTGCRRPLFLKGLHRWLCFPTSIHSPRETGRARCEATCIGTSRSRQIYAVL